MRNFITYMLSLLFLLFVVETKLFVYVTPDAYHVEGISALHSKNSSSKIFEKKVFKDKLNLIVSDYTDNLELNDDDFQISNVLLSLVFFTKIVGVFALFGWIYSFRRKIPFQSVSDLKIQRFKYILLRTIRI